MDTIASILCIQNHNLCVLDAMTCSGYNTGVKVSFNFASAMQLPVFIINLTFFIAGSISVKP